MKAFVRFLFCSFLLGFLICSLFGFVLLLQGQNPPAESKEQRVNFVKESKVISDKSIISGKEADVKEELPLDNNEKKEPLADKKDSFSVVQGSGSGDQVYDSYLYYYNRLSSEEQKLYQICYAGFVALESEIDISEVSFDSLDVWKEKIPYVVNAVLFDHPEMFWCTLEDAQLMSNGSDMFLKVRYQYSEEEVVTLQNQIREKADTCWANVDLEKTDDWSKILIAHDWLVDNVDYIYETSEAARCQNIESAFLDGKTVCTGYAKGLSYLLNLAGCPCIFVSGEGYSQNGSESHAWNIVKFQDLYYNIDVTWDDTMCDTESEGSISDLHLYLYFLRDSDAFIHDHIPNLAYGDYPNCSDDSCYYYKKQGYYLEHDDTEVISSILMADCDAGKSYTVLQCADSGVYDSVKNKMNDVFMNMYGMSDMVLSGDQISYSCSDVYNLLIFTW